MRLADSRWKLCFLEIIRKISHYLKLKLTYYSKKTEQVNCRKSWSLWAPVPLGLFVNETWFSGQVLLLPAPKVPIGKNLLSFLSQMFIKQQNIICACCLIIPLRCTSCRSYVLTLSPLIWSRSGTHESAEKEPEIKPQAWRTCLSDDWERYVSQVWKSCQN